MTLFALGYKIPPHVIIYRDRWMGCCEKAQLHNYAGNWRRLEEVTIDVGMVLVEIA